MTGSIEVICGSMFAGKTDRLISRLILAQAAGMVVRAFKPTRDDRYGEDEVVSHSGLTMPCISLERPDLIMGHVLGGDADVVGIDEIQFFGRNIVNVAQALADSGIKVICAGLDLDYRGEPFHPMPDMMAVAERVTKLLAICAVCAGPAGRSYRTSGDGAKILVGAANAYEARCRRCFADGHRGRTDGS